MRHIPLITFVLLSLVVMAAPAKAQPAFVNGVIIDGATLDATGAAGANDGRFGFFSDLYYDPVTKDWWALSWLRGTELATDILWSRSPAFSRPGARAGLWLAGLGNLAMTVGFAYLSEMES